MKKIYIAMAVLAAVALTSCEGEKSFKNLDLGENSIAFTMKDAALTRAGSIVSHKELPLTIQAGDQEFTIEETVTRLGASGPATKGTPAFTVNVGDLYGSFNGIAKDADGVVIDDGAFNYEAGKDVWVRKFSSDPWGDKSSAFYYLRMPASPGGVENLTYANEQISFDYVSPSAASAQQDMLFGGRTVTKADSGPTVVPVFFHHALTAVMFRVGNQNDSTMKVKTKITNVTLTGIKNKGACVVTPTAENAGYTDEPDTYSSATAVRWELADTAATFTQNYTDTVFFNPADSTFGPSFYNNKTNAQNLNDEAASLTFFFIPQAVSDTAKLTITFNIGGKDIVRTVEFGAALAEAGVTWGAGQMRTYTLTGKEVVVHIEDTIEKTATSTIKSNVQITNQGNCYAYIRAEILGNWCNAAGEAIFGYTYYTDAGRQHEAIETPWTWIYDDDGYAEAPTYGLFSGLCSDENWKHGDDGHFYYVLPVAPGDKTPALFTDFTLDDDEIPHITVSAVTIPVHLVMEIAAQAIEAPMNPDGTFVPVQDAWHDLTELDLFFKED